MSTVEEVTTVDTARVWRIRVPFAGEWLTANRSSRYRFGAIDWRNATNTACHAARLPKAVTPVAIHVVAHYVGRRPVRDRQNLYPTVKAIVDGLTPTVVRQRAGIPHTRGGYGLIPDDSDKHVHDLTWELKPSREQQPWAEVIVMAVTA